MRQEDQLCKGTYSVIRACSVGSTVSNLSSSNRHRRKTHRAFCTSQRLIRLITLLMVASNMWLKIPEEMRAGGGRRSLGLLKNQFMMPTYLACTFFLCFAWWVASSSRCTHAVRTSATIHMCSGNLPRPLAFVVSKTPIRSTLSSSLSLLFSSLNNSCPDKTRMISNYCYYVLPTATVSCCPLLPCSPTEQDRSRELTALVESDPAHGAVHTSLTTNPC